MKKKSEKTWRLGDDEPPKKRVKKPPMFTPAKTMAYSERLHAAVPPPIPPPLSTTSTTDIAGRVADVTARTLRRQSTVDVSNRDPDLPTEVAVWFEQAIRTIAVNMNSQDHRKARFVEFLSAIDEAYVHLYRWRNEKSPTIKIGLQDNDEKNREGFALPLMRNEASELLENIPAVVFRNLCTYAIDRTLRDIESGDLTEHHKNDVATLQAIRVAINKPNIKIEKIKKLLKFYSFF